jgi:hypothetical protein
MLCVTRFRLLDGGNQVILSADDVVHDAVNIIGNNIFFRDILNEIRFKKKKLHVCL